MNILNWVRYPTCADGTMQYSHSGADIATKKVVAVGIGTNQAMVAIAGPATISSGVANAGTVYVKGVARFPAVATAFSQGAVVQWDGSLGQVSTGGTTAGLICVGECLESSPGGSIGGASSPGVLVAINEGPKAFYQW